MITSLNQTGRGLAFRERLEQLFLRKMTDEHRMEYLNSGSFDEMARRVLNAFFLFLCAQTDRNGECKIALRQDGVAYSPPYFMQHYLGMLQLLLCNRVHGARASDIHSVIQELYGLLDDFKLEIYPKKEAEVLAFPSKQIAKRQ